MAFADDLLAQAKYLANKEPLHPKQASLRRAVSSAYYALFHLLIDDAASILAPPAPPGIHKIIQRAFSHGQIKTACKAIIEANVARSAHPPKRTQLPIALERILSFPVEGELLTVLHNFVALHEARHKADYDLSEDLIRVAVLTNIQLAEQAFSAWLFAKTKPNAAVFVSALAFHKDWAKYN